MKNKEKFLNLVSEEETDTVKEVKQRIKNRAMLRESQRIAMKVLLKLEELGWSQRKLATKMEVTPQFITKIVKGQENLTLETQIKLQTILDIPVLASYYTEQAKKNRAQITLKVNNSQHVKPVNLMSAVYSKATTPVIRKGDPNVMLVYKAS